MSCALVDIPSTYTRQGVVGLDASARYSRKGNAETAITTTTTTGMIAWKNHQVRRHVESGRRTTSRDKEGNLICPKCGASLVNKKLVDGKELLHCYCGEWYEDCTTATFDPIKW